ncbi:MAG TPA: chemotaxis protein CheW [Planctomycetota bacterium]|nr:chemotaxis protein CheW [Planctomycetota bacterium]
MDQLGSQFLTFTLGDEEYGIDLLKVQEIKGCPAITRIPNTPPHIRGVMNLRGAVVPVLDLRARFGLPEPADRKLAVIILVNIRAKIVGLVVDAVSDVLDVKREDVEAAPALGDGIDTTFLTGMAKAGEKLILLLDLDRIAGLSELAASVAA